MYIRYKIDVLSELKKHGYNTTRMRKEKLLNESAIQKLREGKSIGLKSLGRICLMLDAQPNDIIEFVKEGVETPLYPPCEGGTDTKSM